MSVHINNKISKQKNIQEISLFHFTDFSSLNLIFVHFSTASDQWSTILAQTVSHSAGISEIHNTDLHYLSSSACPVWKSGENQSCYTKLMSTHFLLHHRGVSLSDNTKGNRDPGAAFNPMAQPSPTISKGKNNCYRCIFPPSVSAFLKE